MLCVLRSEMLTKEIAFLIHALQLFPLNILYCSYLIHMILQYSISKCFCMRQNCMIWRSLIMEVCVSPFALCSVLEPICLLCISDQMISHNIRAYLNGHAAET